MIKRQFTIRSLLIATFLVAVSLPVGIRHYDDAMTYLFPPPKPPEPTATQIVRNLLRRVPAGSAREIMIRQVGEDEFEVTFPGIESEFD